MVKKAVFVLGTLDFKAAYRGEALDARTLDLLTTISDRANVDVEVVFAVQDPRQAGKAKAKIKIKTIRAERPRVLDEIGHSKPDFVMCFGPVATASVFDKGSLVEGELLRREHRPLGKDQPPVYVTFSMENVRYKAGLAKWLALDVEAAAQGWGEPQFADYELILPGDHFWEKMPPFEIACIGTTTGPKVIGYDLETFPGLNPWHKQARIRMAVISDQVGRAWVVQAKPNSELPQWVYDLIEDPNVIKAGSNIKYDYRWHRRFGHPIVNMYDTSTHEHIIDESNPKKDLKSLTFRYVPKLADYSRGHRDLVRERGGWEYVADDEQYEYAGGDGEASIGTYLGQQPLLEGFERPRQLMGDLYDVLARIEHNGACVDVPMNRKLDTLYEEKLFDLRQQIVDVLGPINLNAPAQLAEALKAAVPIINLSLRDWKRALGDGEDEETTTKRAILERESHKHPIIEKVLEFRSYRTRHSTFIKGVFEKHLCQHLSNEWYIHPSFRTDVTETYRLSTRQPSGQNIPRKDNDDPDLTIKKQFVSRFEGGEILEADQSQVEIRFAAWLSQDPKMIAAIESGEDIHYAMAAIMLDKKVPPKNQEDTCDPDIYVTKPERQECKTRTFLILYGGGANKLASDLKISRRRAQRMIDEYFETFKGLKQYIDQVHLDVRRDLMVKTVFGFERRFVEPEHWDSRDGWSIYRQAFNTKVQSGAACITYLAMIWLDQAIHDYDLKSKMILQIHDSIVVDVHPGERDQVVRLIRQAMEVETVRMMANEYDINFTVPLKCDVGVGKNWGELHEVGAGTT
jgi:DNA polymerase-1